MPAEYWEQGKEKSRNQLELERLEKLRGNIVGFSAPVGRTKGDEEGVDRSSKKKGSTKTGIFGVEEEEI